MKLFLFVVVALGSHSVVNAGPFIGDLLKSSASLSSDMSLCTPGVRAACKEAFYKPSDNPTACMTVPTDSQIGKVLASSDNDGKFGPKCVSAHNDKRRTPFTDSSHGAVYGGDMMMMYWDDELAAVARTHVRNMAQKNQMYHDECKRTPNYNYVGQNVVFGPFDESQEVDCGSTAVDMWYDEIKKITYNDFYPSYNFGMYYGHYSQVMWADSYKVGCAYLKFQKNGGTQISLACNYAMAGNMEGEPMMKPSPNLGSACPAGSKLGASKLCEVVDEAKLRQTIGLGKSESKNNQQNNQHNNQQNNQHNIIDNNNDFDWNNFFNGHNGGNGKHYFDGNGNEIIEYEYTY